MDVHGQGESDTEREEGVRRTTDDPEEGRERKRKWGRSDGAEGAAGELAGEQRGRLGSSDQSASSSADAGDGGVEESARASKRNKKGLKAQFVSDDELGRDETGASCGVGWFGRKRRQIQIEWVAGMISGEERAPQVHRATLDSGANCCIVNASGAHRLQSEGLARIEDAEASTRVQTADGQWADIEYVVKGFGLIREAMVMEKAPTALITTDVFLEKGMQIVMYQGVAVVTHEGREVARARQNTDTRVFEFDLQQLFALGMQNEGSRAAAARASAQPRFSKGLQRDAMKFHEDLGHAFPYSTMASNIRNGSWLNVPDEFTASLFDYMAARVKCPLCAAI